MADLSWSMVWLLDDILAFRDTGELVKRKPLRLQTVLLTALEVHNRLDIPYQILHQAYRLQRPHLAPLPAGRVGNRGFYLRREVEQWERDYADVLAARRGGKRAPYRADPRPGRRRRAP